MQNSLHQSAQKYIKEHLHEKRWKRAVTVLACVVVFCTTYALILPALTMTGSPFCGKEAHKHSEACYETVLVCGKEEGETEPAHIHTDACYETRQVLTCGQEESAGHTHGDDCYNEAGELTCGQEEFQGHAHTEACYGTESVLVCGQEEGVPSEAHVHTDACYEKKLVCGLEEHEHTLACYSDPNADVEDAAAWERSVSGAARTGVWADDAAAVAGTQLGYQESTKNYIVTEAGEQKGITRYGQWYGDPYGSWDAMFVSFCLNYAGIPQSAVPYGADCGSWTAALSAAGLYRSAGTYAPAKGDIVFFDRSGDGAANHVGMVVKTAGDGASFDAIEGDLDNQVRQVTHGAGETGILGFAALPENPAAVPAETEAPAETMPSGTNGDTANGLPAEAPEDAEPAEDADGALQPAAQNADAQSIALGETKTITVGAGETVKLQFVPEYSHEFVFYSSVLGDSYGYLYDENEKQLAYDDDGGERNNFKITYKLEGGKTYFWGAKWLGSNTSGDMTVHLELGANHVFVENEQGKFVCVCGAAAPTSGKCGDDLYWALDTETGTISITGTGNMAGYSNNTKAPWQPFADLIRHVTIAEGATSIGGCAFQNCAALETVSFPSTLTRIGTNAFDGCSSLTRADLSNTGLQNVDHYVFQDCAALTEVLLPDTVTYIGSSTFRGCTSLTKMDLSETKVSYINPSAFMGCKSLAEVRFPGTLTNLGSDAFRNCGALTEVDLSETMVSSIGAYAFSGCTSLTEVKFPDALTQLGSSAFNGCAALREADLSGTGLTSVSGSVFSNCSALEAVSLPAAVTSIRDRAFYGCGALTKMDLSGMALTGIGDSAFSGCKSLTEVSFPGTLRSLGTNAFYDCGALREIDLSGTDVTSIGSNAFQRCFALEKIQVPAVLRNIGSYAFGGCGVLRELDLSATAVTSIGGYAFLNCVSLETMTLPQTVKDIGLRAFDGCGGLTELRLAAKDIVINADQTAAGSGFHVTVAATVDQLSGDTFAALIKIGCNGMSFTGPNYLTAGNWQADFLPEQLNGLPQSEYFVDEQGVFYRIDSGTNTASVFYCPPGITKYTVPRELPAADGKTEPVPVTGVESSAFREAANLMNLTFASPETITRLSDLAFFHAVNLERINGQTEADAVLASFPAEDLTTGTMLFWQTKIGGSGEQPTKDPLEVEKEELKVIVSTEQGKYRDPLQAEDGTYLYYTGETARTTVTISNPNSAEADNGTVVRIYFRFDGKNGRLNYAPGTYTVVSTEGKKCTLRVVEAETPGCYYAELDRPAQGDTISIILESSYPSPTSGGGNGSVWCGILTKAEKASVGDGLIPVGTHQGMNWTTAADTFPITKKEESAGSSKLVGNGNGGAYISGLKYTVTMGRAGSTLEGIGKDHMVSVDFQDVLKLPEGVSLSENVLKAIREGTVTVGLSPYGDGGYYFETPDKKTFLYISPNNASTNYRYLRSGAVTLNENGDPVIRWSFQNADVNTEIGNMTFTYWFTAGALFVAQPQADVTYVVHNEVTAIQHFMYSDDQVQRAECTATVKEAEGSLQISKSGSGGGYFGASRKYTIAVSNPGALPYDKLAYLTDEMPIGVYMRPKDLAAVFADDPEHRLTVTIVRATLCEPKAGEAISGIDGTPGVTDLQNSGSHTAYSGLETADADTVGLRKTITIGWGENGQLQIAVQDGQTLSCPAEETAIGTALDQLGFVVTKYTAFNLKWDLRDPDGSVQPLPGGARYYKTIPCAAKDTFMRLEKDTYGQYPDSYESDRNYAYGRNSAEVSLKYDYAYSSPDREFALGKGWTKDGQSVESDTVIRQSDILDYVLRVTHKWSDAQYDALPLTDHMSGAQALLVPAAKNSGAEWAQGLQTVTDKGTEYYVLNKPGTYRNVWTSEDQLADTVQVTQSASGLDTLIKWYFVNYTGNRTDTVSYRAYVCPKETASGSLTYSLGNESWLNDHQAQRLYSNLSGWVGTAFDFDKVIVDSVGDTGDGFKYSQVKEGQTVVYRLVLDADRAAEGDAQPLTITGSDMFDALPLSIGTWRWSKENVRITYADGDQVANGDSWTIEGGAQEDQQYIRWADDFSMTFTGKAYIYVELTFPSGTQWQEYAVQYATTTLENTFQVLGAQRIVTHDVSIAGQVRLQKGVSATGYLKGISFYEDMNGQESRLYYQNNDVKVRGVQYYVSLYNGGPTNLYLTDLQDLLPRGFTYGGRDGTLTATSGGSTDGEVLRDDGKAADLKYAYVRVQPRTDADGRTRLVFHIEQTGSTASNEISYDSSRNMCYLKPGEAIRFAYACNTNNTADTDDAARNIVTMPYYDFNGGGVVVDDQCSITAPKTDRYTPNDGGCDVLDNGQAEALGFTGGEVGTQWLASEVTQIRGEIRPGITKALTSKTDKNGVTTQDPISAAPADTLNWTIKTENDGTYSITDYVLTDRMQAPYRFTGKVGYRIYRDPDGSSTVGENYYGYLFAIEPGENDETLSIRTNPDEVQTLTIGGDPITLSCRWIYNIRPLESFMNVENVNVQLAIARDGEGNMVMSLRFPDKTMSIPENGCSELTLSTCNTTNILENRQFINACFVTPMVQAWDNTTNKGNVVNMTTPFGEGEMPTVRNSAPVTTAYGYVTGSSKRVTEVVDPANTAACTDAPNYIVLKEAGNSFRYTLTVNNSTPKALDMLVLIDGLPEVGDHTVFLASDLRFSEFKVRLAQDPDFQVTVTDKQGNATTLSADQYAIEYSTATEFTSADWKGTSTWSADAENARSIRLKILDSTGTLIPAESIISFAFTCETDDPNVQPGQTAWNSFGYHYSLLGEAAELEAAPLKVGVKIPSVPELRKQTVDHAGQPRTAEQDETFRFLVYPGEPLSGSYATEKEWAEALGETPYEVFSVTVKAGENLSSSVRMQTAKWQWTEGAKYTIAELPCGENYAFRRFRGTAASVYTLTYTPAQTQIVTCENTDLRWRIDLTKENTSHAPLGGAVFALYSPDAADQLSSLPEEYAGLDIGLTLEHGGRTWYLKQVRITPEDGKLTWTGLLREEYYLLEVKAPNGYEIDLPAGQTLKQEDETQGIVPVTVVNRASIFLPETGGTGTHPYTLGGTLLLFSAAALLLYFRARRRRGNHASA